MNAEIKKNEEIIEVDYFDDAGNHVELPKGFTVVLRWKNDSYTVAREFDSQGHLAVYSYYCYSKESGVLNTIKYDTAGNVISDIHYDLVPKR